MLASFALFYNLMEVKIILLTFLFLNIGFTVYLDPYQNQNIDIEGNINQEIQVKFSYNKIISVRPSNGTLPDYAEIIPNRFKIVNIIEKNILPDLNRTLVYELRTPFSNKYSHLLGVNGSLVTFSHPNHFIFIEKTSFKVQNQFTLPEMAKGSSIIQTIGDSFILIILSIDEVIILNKSQSFKQKNVFNTTEKLTIKKINLQNQTYFITIVNQEIIIFSIQNGTLNIMNKASLTEKIADIEISSFLLGKAEENGQQIWLIDENKGLYFTVLGPNLTIEAAITLISSQKGCYDLDSKKDWHSFSILLTCLNQEYATFKILLFDNDKFKIPFLLKTTEAVNQRSAANKFFFLKNYIYSQEASSLDIFTQGLSGNGKDGFEKYWIKFTEINSFLMSIDQDPKKILIYSLHQGIISQRELIQESYSLSLYSPDPISTVLTFTVNYLCEKGINREPQICESEMSLKLNLHNNIVSYVQYKSINTAIVLILSTTFLALLLLCRYKYNSIYRKTYKEFKEISNPTKCQF